LRLGDLDFTPVGLTETILHYHKTTQDVTVSLNPYKKKQQDSFEIAAIDIFDTFD
jgi:hypothetical protein